LSFSASSFRAEKPRRPDGTRTILVAAIGGLAVFGLVLPPLPTAASLAAAIRAKYRAALTAECFGPASAVCGNLTRAGVRSFTAAAPGERCGYWSLNAPFRARPRERRCDRGAELDPHPSLPPESRESCHLCRPTASRKSAKGPHVARPGASDETGQTRSRAFRSRPDDSPSPPLGLPACV